MAGVKDQKKRLILKKLLRLKANRDKSDRDIATEAGVSRALVKAVRTEMIAAGLLPKYERPEGGNVRRDAYQPGASARGGYVYDDKGNVVREVDWVLTHGRGRKRAGTSG